MDCETSKQIKLLLIAPLPPPVGGIATWTSYFLNYAISRPEVEVVHLDSAQRYRPVSPNSFAQRLLSGLAVWTPLVFRLLKCLVQGRPHLIHCQTSGGMGFFRDWMVICLARLFRVPVVVHFHFGRCPALVRQRNWEYRMLRRVASTADGVIVLDRSSMKALQENGFTNMYLVPNPLAPELEKMAMAYAVDAPLRKKNRVLFVGHVIAEKGVHDLVRACAALPEVEELNLIGPVEPACKAELIVLSSSRDSGRWLMFAGVKEHDEVLMEMLTATLLVLPSRTEAFPIVLLEAMAMACPVVATAVAAMPDMLNAQGKEKAGICVPPGNIDALRDAIRYIIKNPDIGAQLGICGRRKVVADYTIDRIFKQYWTVWKQVAEVNK